MNLWCLRRKFDPLDIAGGSGKFSSYFGQSSAGSSKLVSCCHLTLPFQPVCLSSSNRSSRPQRNLHGRRRMVVEDIIIIYEERQLAKRTGNSFPLASCNNQNMLQRWQAQWTQLIKGCGTHGPVLWIHPSPRSLAHSHLQECLSLS